MFIAGDVVFNISFWLLVGVVKDFKLNLSSLGFLVSELAKIVQSKKSYRVNISEWKSKRGLSANGQQHVWYKQISEQTHNDIKSVEARCKIDFGVPIMLCDDKYGPVLGYILDKTNFWKLSNEQQEKLIQGIEVTRKMNSSQHNQYRDNMQVYWHSNGISIDYKNN